MAEAARKTFTAEYRFKIERSCHLVICITHEGHIIDWNPTADRIFGLSDLNLYGKNFVDTFIDIEDRPKFEEAFSKLRNKQRTSGFPCGLKLEDQSPKTLLWSFTPIVDEHDCDLGISIIGHDITEYEQAHQKRLALLERAKLHQEEIVRISKSEAFINGDLSCVIKQIAESTAKALQVERSGIWFLDPDNKTLVCQDLYQREGFERVDGLMLHADDYPTYFKALEQGRALDAHDVATDPRTIEFLDIYLQPLGITSMLDAPIRVSGKVVGVICNEHIGEKRYWSLEEINFAAEYADLIAQTIVNKERSLAEIALRESEEKFRKLAENIEEVFWLTTSDKSKCLYVSPAYERIWGKPPQELYDDPSSWLKVIHPDDLNFVLMSRKLQSLGGFDVEFRIIHPDGEVKWIRDRAYPIKSESGEVSFIAGIAEDITELKQAESERLALERQLQQSQKMEALGQLAGGIAHDFNNILSAIIGYAELLRDELKQNPKHSSYNSAVLAGAQRAKDLIKQILTFSRKHEIVFEPVTVIDVIEGVLALLQVTRPPNVSFVKNYSDSPVIQADKHSIFQMIMNLSTNAIYAMKESGGELKIKVETVSFNDLPANAALPRSEHGYMRLKISDSGVGFSKDELQKAFDPFFTSKPIGEGTGLGLSVVHGIVNAHSGHIEIESELGSGASVLVYLPCSSSTRIKTAGKKIQSDFNGSEHIMVVDDELMIAKLAKEMLELHGYRVSIFTDPKKALKELEDNHEVYDLLLTDLTMSGLTGFELAQELEKISKTKPVVIFSGFGFAQSKSNASESNNIVSRITKPFSMQDLVGTIRKSLDRISKQG